MRILGIIMLVVGLVLMIVARNLTGYLPPQYRMEDDGFPELMRSMGNCIKVAGILLLIAAGIIFFVG